MPEEMKNGFEVTTAEETTVDEQKKTGEQLTTRDMAVIGGLALLGVGLIVKGVKKVFGRKKKAYAEVPVTGEYFKRG